MPDLHLEFSLEKKIIKKDIEKEFEKAKADSLQKKLALWYTGGGGDQYFRFVLSQIVEAFCKWVTKNKIHLYIRISSYTLVVFMLSYTWRAISLG